MAVLWGGGMLLREFQMMAFMRGASQTVFDLRGPTVRSLQRTACCPSFPLSFDTFYVPR